MNTEQHLTRTVEYLSDFFLVLSDGYNPTAFWMNIDLNQQLYFEHLVEKDYLGRKRVSMALNSRTEMNGTFESLLDSYFEWCLEHLHSCNCVQEIFQKDYKLDELRQLVLKVKKELSTYFDTWNAKYTEYTVDTLDGSLEKYLFINSGKRSAYFVFGNYIH